MWHVWETGEVHTGGGELREREHLEEPIVGGRIILRWIFRKWDGGGMDWTELAQDSDWWWALVNAVMNLRGSIKCGEFLDWLRTCQLLKKGSVTCSKFR